MLQRCSTTKTLRDSIQVRGQIGSFRGQRLDEDHIIKTIDCFVKSTWMEGETEVETNTAREVITEISKLPPGHDRLQNVRSCTT